jgi:hypothetical protein
MFYWDSCKLRAGGVRTEAYRRQRRKEGHVIMMDGLRLLAHSFRCLQIREKSSGRKQSDEQLPAPSGSSLSFWSMFLPNGCWLPSFWVVFRGPSKQLLGSKKIVLSQAGLDLGPELLPLALTPWERLRWQLLSRLMA